MKFNTKKDDKVVEVVVNGVKLSGTSEEVTQILNLMGVKDIKSSYYYKSETKGVVEILGMATPHIRNAIIKRYSEWVSDLKGLSNRELLERLENGPEGLDGLVQELTYRVNYLGE